ncbi:MAG: hypothetical protein OT477_17260 [Chloroflexi bacterium]|nr:hypothetical protein [Chloroflexota bacterium]
METGEIFCRICGRNRYLPVKQWQIVVFTVLIIALAGGLFTLFSLSSSVAVSEKLSIHTPTPTPRLMVTSSPVAVIEIQTVSPSLTPHPISTQKPQLPATATLQPSPTRTLRPTQTATPKPSPTLTHVPPSPTAIQVTTCSQTPGPRWGSTLWNQYKSQLGCPLNQETRTGGAYQIYQRGIAVWRQDANRIYFLYNNGTYAFYPDNSPTGYYHSNMLKGGFGYLWNNNNTVRDSLGEPIAIEANATNFAIQDFADGTIFYFLENNAFNYVLFSNNTWTSTQD